MKHQQLGCFAMLLVAVAFTSLAVGGDDAAKSTASYQVLDTSASAPRQRLRAEPVTLRGRADRVRLLSTVFSRDGKRVTTIDGKGRLVRWDLEKPGERKHLLNLKTELACAVLSNDGSLLAFADQDGTVATIELGTKKERLRVKSPADRTVALAFSTDGSRLAGVTENGNIEFHMLDGEAISLALGMSVPRSAVQQVAFSPDGKQLAVASFSSEVKLFDLSTLSGPKLFDLTSKIPSEIVKLSEARVTALAFSPDGRKLVLASADGTTRVVDRAGDRPAVMLDTHAFAVWSLTFDRNGARLAAASWDGTIRFWETTAWELLASHKSHEESIAAMAFGPNGDLVSASLDGPLKHWPSDVPSIPPVAMIAGRADSVWVGVYSPNGKQLFVGGFERRFELWDVTKNKLVWSHPGQQTTRCAAFSPDGNTLATGGDGGKVILWDTQTQKRRLTLVRHPGAVSAVVFTSNGKTIVSGCDGGVVKLWDATTGAEKASWHEHKQQIYCANISPDGKWLFTGGGNWTTGDPGELIVWELETGRVRAKLDGNRLAIWAIAFTPDGKQFATSNSSGDVLIWASKTLTVERTLTHAMWIRWIAIAPDGKALAVGRGDGSVRLWDTADWKQKASLDGHDGFTFFLNFSPDGNTLATSGNDGTVRFWPTGH
jgi:WD40 repeat protein